MKYYLVLFSLVCITGCSASPKQHSRLEQRRVDFKHQVDQEQKLKYAEAEQCASHGFDPITSFARCITQIDQAKHIVIAEYKDSYLYGSGSFDRYADPTQTGKAGEAFGGANAEVFGGTGIYYNNRINNLPQPSKHNIKCTKNPVNFIVSCNEL